MGQRKDTLDTPSLQWPCVCVCVRACVRACVHAALWLCVCVHVLWVYACVMGACVCVHVCWMVHSMTYDCMDVIQTHWGGVTWFITWVSVRVCTLSVNLCVSMYVHTSVGLLSWRPVTVQWSSTIRLCRRAVGGAVCDSRGSVCVESCVARYRQT